MNAVTAHSEENPPPVDCHQRDGRVHLGAARHSHTCTSRDTLRRGPVRAALIRPRSMRGEATMSSHEVCARLRAYRERRRREFERRLEQHRQHVLLVEQVRLHVR